MAATTVYEKIEKLKTIKDDLKTNIESYGVTVGTAPFDEYPAKVLEIPTTDSVKALIDAVNEESGGATIQDSIALVDSNYTDIKAAITAKGVDMTGVKPSGFDAKIASIVAAPGDAVAGDILAGKTAATAAGLVTGTRPPTPVANSGYSSESGIAWPSPRFVDNGNGTTTDKLTGLMWAKRFPVDDTNRSRAAQETYAANSTLGGYSDWRIPSVTEITSVIDWSLTAPKGGPVVTAAFDNQMGTNLFYCKNGWRGRINGFFLQDDFGATTELRTIIVRGPIAL